MIKKLHFIALITLLIISSAQATNSRLSLRYTRDTRAMTPNNCYPIKVKDFDFVKNQNFKEYYLIASSRKSIANGLDLEHPISRSEIDSVHQFYKKFIPPNKRMLQKLNFNNKSSSQYKKFEDTFNNALKKSNSSTQVKKYINQIRDFSLTHHFKFQLVGDVMEALTYQAHFESGNLLTEEYNPNEYFYISGVQYIVNHSVTGELDFLVIDSNTCQVQLVIESKSSPSASGKARSQLLRFYNHVNN